MSRIQELREFVRNSDRGSTLELPHDSAAELLSEVESVTHFSELRRLIGDALNDEELRAEIQDRKGVKFYAATD